MKDSEVGHSDEHPEELNLEVHLEAQLKQSLLLQDWLNRESPLCATEDQSSMTQTHSHMNEVRLNQLTGAKEKDLSGSKVIKPNKRLNELKV